MTPKRYPPTDPREWLNRAKSNLVRAEAMTSGAYLEDLCFDAQQAAEKAIKAVFVHRGEPFPYIHDIEELLDRLSINGVKVPKYVRQADKLSQYAVATRYPGAAGPITKKQHRRAIRIAKLVLGWAERMATKP
ncbi:MAG TPA: HEPN domain-containing protein [Gemmataceae bacterium]|nr:HEPN domain-containing protein [Gemmataceae bacterium]